ncbi:MAG: TIGR03000 domain-containing protein [Planctomycetia bacterium]|nr:TIGR03000 domain-containing protein [Planctomycetia bacterium]
MSSSMPVESYRVIDPAPASGGEAIATPQPAKTDSTAIPADAALLVVTLPAEAQVFVNGTKTSATGSLRRYVSRGLEAGKDYEYVVRMVVDRDGAEHEETRVVSLSAGVRKTVEFGAVAPTAQAVKAAPKTSLTLHVPADAKVFLAGNETSSQGETRLFETTSLRDGQTWKNYEVRVTRSVDGREHSAAKTIDLAAGSAVELSLDPAAGRTAAVDATAALR